MWEANYCHCSDEIWIAEKFCLEQYPGLGLSKLMFKAFFLCSYVCLSFRGFCNFALLSVNKGEPEGKGEF